MEIQLSDNIRQYLKSLRLTILSFTADVTGSHADFFNVMDQLVQNIQKKYQLDTISKNSSIASAREAYKLCGKDPARYRPSAESLLRRVVKERDLYRVNNVVDILNYISILSGISIGGYNSDKISGKVQMDIGQETDYYSGIGRGTLNITGMPVLRDNIGVFGTPTSDSERTMITEHTKNITFVFFDFGLSPQLVNDILTTTEMLKKYANGINFMLSEIVF